MQIKTNTDNTIEHHSSLDDHVDTVVKGAVQRFGEQITRVEVHLSDKVKEKSADGENRCLMEARVTGYQPVVVSAHAATLHQSIASAADKLERAIDSALGRLHDSHRHAGIKGGAVVADEAGE